ncbi:pyrroloquinoline quinone biosynthesis peptide chaperone PqqD [Variovorax beijingensis]|uniref:PqqA binding protein n=1 Tax=Variovorax beijingensis TaxID=2496117 RepID=A0A3P3EV27_9BURK|nr:pyrroloquinoline quinone biosynthesis peptide chaperone PqqD [Variovorax beijingensis]RRH89692.1 pyrroloquinoline quinone biosynthesis peptide chaperone PqqD [Variovorax beijingensis]RSZ41644.1 pyrroloquinoline quinone biosynthesis peptide chaperone PqqD [Variovorax beijingensis]
MTGNKTMLTAESKPRVGPGFRLQWESAQECHVLLYPEGMVRLNGSAGEIMKRCDGERSVAAIVADLEQAFDTTGLEPEVRGFVEMAAQQNWLRWDPQ